MYQRSLGLAALAGSLLLGSTVLAGAQTLEDGIMLTRGTLCAGALYGHSQWSQYWEGSLQRVNGNIGTVRTQSVAAMANYGITNRINVLSEIPYIWTDASQGVLHSQSGVQDLTLAAKVDALRIPLKQSGSLHAIVTVRAAYLQQTTTPISSRCRSACTVRRLWAAAPSAF